MGQSVLLIDDSPEMHELLDVRLSPEEVVVLHATNAHDGMRLADGCDLILLDIHLPEVGGFEICQRLKSDPRTATIPVIFVTSCTDTETKVRGLELGAVDFVTKPFEPNELRARVRAALRSKSYLDLLSARAQIDGLTGLWNRAYFDEQLDRAVVRHQRDGGEVSLILCDIDHFKSVNDRFGHPFGDRALQALARTVGASLRRQDTFCRYGGEEFAVVLLDTDLAYACAVAERMRVAMRSLELAHEGRPVAITSSFGVASSAAFEGRGVVTRERLIEVADRALYAAKSAGRNQVSRAGPTPG